MKTIERTPEELPRRKPIKHNGKPVEEKTQQSIQEFREAALSIVREVLAREWKVDIDQVSWGSYMDNNGRANALVQEDIGKVIREMGIRTGEIFENPTGKSLKGIIEGTVQKMMNFLVNQKKKMLLPPPVNTTKTDRGANIQSTNIQPIDYPKDIKKRFEMYLKSAISMMFITSPTWANRNGELATELIKKPIASNQTWESLGLSEEEMKEVIANVRKKITERGELYLSTSKQLSIRPKMTLQQIATELLA